MVEGSLNDILHLAHLWDCILLLDEADIFLTARSAADLKRNGIVSVFLRIMEYYKGILFLTTNRVGKLDPAINSRIHVTLHYKRFSEHDLREIFKMNIEKLKEVEEQRFAASQRIEPSESARLHVVDSDILRFASDHFHRHTTSRDTSPCNGRQVRNAFVVASTLARREAAAQKRPPQLRACHFQEVKRFTSDFNRFRANLMGGDDSHIASKRDERDDSWRNDLGEGPPRSFNKSRLSMMLESSNTVCGSSTATTPVSTRPSLRSGFHQQPLQAQSLSPSSTISEYLTPEATKPVQRSYSRTLVHDYHTPKSMGSPPSLSPPPLRSQDEKYGAPVQAYAELPELYSEYGISQQVSL